MTQQRLIAAMAQALEDAVDTLRYHEPEQFDDDEHRATWNGRLANYVTLAHLAKASARREVPPKQQDVLLHVLAMADDSYLAGHPEWIEIVAETRAAIEKGGAYV